MKLQSPLFIKLLAACFSTAVWMLFRTLRMRFCTSAIGTNPYVNSGSERYLYCVWHDSMVMPTFGGRHVCTTALISQHADGSFVAQVLRLNRVAAIRGSTNRIRTGAIRELMKTAEHQHIVITPDGPRGPNRQMSAGMAFLASRTGRAVIPTAYVCSRHWRIRGSWSDLIIPKPFARVVLFAGPPIYVPAGLTSDQLSAEVARIQRAMEAAQVAADELLRAPPRKSA